VILWRISNYGNLEGAGGLKASGRWHTRGRHIVYLASSPSSALLEILVHLELSADQLPRNYQLLEIHAPDEILIENVDIAAFPSDWIADRLFTQRIGNAWLDKDSSALLQIPSALVPNTSNYLLNPAHSDAKRILIVSTSQHLLDPRLLQRTL
jgi:RES domain-containing protein